MAQKDILSVAIVGCGAITQSFYCEALKAVCVPDCLRVDALVDPSSENRARLRAAFPAAEEFSTVADASIGESSLVIVASPPALHAEHSIFALRRGAAVLCEKPMAASIEQAEMMISAARETKGLLAIGLYRRYFTAAEAIRSIIANQTLGSLARFRICEGGPFGWQAASESFFRRGATPGGVLYDTGVHTLDLLIWWLGEPSEIGYEDDAMGGLEANCKLALSYDNECKGEIRLSRDWKTDNQYAFFFERGNVKWTVNDANHLELYGDGMPASVRGELLLHPETGERRAPYRPALTNPQCFIEQVRNLAAAKRGEVAIRVSGDEGIRSLRLIDRCYKQREMMDMPWLTDEEMLVARRCSRATTERRRW